MTRQVSRAVFWGGFVLYIVSLGLPTFRGQGVFTSESPSVAEWALGAFLSPLIYLHQSSGEHFLEDLNIAKMSFFLNGWINPLFLLTMVFIVLSKTPKLVKVLRYLTLFMVPICWLALAYQHVYPHEGYILWTLGIVLVLFSKGLDNWPYVVPGPRGETPTPKTQQKCFDAETARRAHRLRGDAALRMFLPMKTTKIPLIVLASLASLCLAVAAATQQAVPGTLATGFNTIREDTLRADLTFVASDTLQGRMSLQNGDEVAIQWIASEFAKAGLKPAANGSFLQLVPLIEYRGDRENSYVALKRGGSETQWKFPDAFGSYHSDVDVTADVVFAGYGITAPELHYDDYQGIDVHGKIVLILDHEPQETDPNSIFNGTGNTRYATGRVKILNAQEHGAVGVLIVAEPNRKHPSNQERIARIGGSITRAVPLPSQALAEDALHTPAAIISDAVGKELFATAGVAPSELQAAIDRDLKPQSRALPDTQVTLHYRNLFVHTGTTYNVAGLLEGSDPKLKAETILFSGHHDHDGTSGDQIWHGADDNGSGTVGVVALAHAFAANAAHGEKPKRSLLFVVYAAEERGLLGSFYMAAHPLRPLETTRAVVNFDMIGRNETESDQTKGLIDIPADTTNRLNLIGASYSPDYNRTVVQENKYVGLDLDYRFDRDYALNIFFRSDQFPFVLHNIPSFWWFTGFHPDYHHTTDTADKINYVKMAKILRLAYLTGFQFANEATPPKFVANPGGKGTSQAN